MHGSEVFCVSFSRGQLWQIEAVLKRQKVLQGPLSGYFGARSRNDSSRDKVDIREPFNTPPSYESSLYVLVAEKEASERRYSIDKTEARSGSSLKKHAA